MDMAVLLIQMDITIKDKLNMEEEMGKVYIWQVQYYSKAILKIMHYMVMVNRKDLITTSKDSLNMGLKSMEFSNIKATYTKVLLKMIHLKEKEFYWLTKEDMSVTFTKDFNTVMVSSNGKMVANIEVTIVVG